MNVPSPFTNKISFTLYFFLFSFTLYSQTPDFKVQHLQNEVARTGGTNTSFTAVSSLNSAIELANNNRKTHAGANTNSGILHGDDMSGARQLTAVNTLTYYRESASENRNMRFNTSIWEYIGPTGGGNELIVRGRYAISLDGSVNSVTQAISGVISANKCIPFITGITNDATKNNADSTTAIAFLEDSTTLRIQKGSDDNDVIVYITLVEFTGANWTVLHGDSGDTDTDSGSITLRNGSDGTGTSTDVSSWSDAVIFSHFRADTDDSGDNEAISDLWPVVDPGANNQTVNWTFHSNHDSEGYNRHFVHILTNSGLNVTRFQDTDSDAGESTIDITSAGLSNINEALIVGSSTSSGKGIQYGRGWRNYYLNSTIEAAHWAHRNNNTLSHEIQIVDLSSLVTTYAGTEINVQGNGVDIPDGNTLISTTDDTDFGGIEVTSGSVSHTFTIQNLGSIALTLDGASPYIVLTGDTADFTLTANPSTPISAGGSTTFTITYDPTTSGTHLATISIANSDTDENPYTFDVQGIGEYCNSNGSTDYDTSITYVSFNTISNADNEIPKDNGYEDFTDQSTNVYINSTHTLTVNVDTDGNYIIYTNVWIDWNRDGDFDDAGETYDMGSAVNVSDLPTSNSPLSVTVPASAVIGEARMRVATKWSDYPSSCEAGFDGEVEDYTINIIDYIIDFDGVDDCIDFGNTHNLTSSFSLEAWVLQEATVTSGTVIANGNLETGSNTGYHFTLKNNYPNLIWYDGSGTEVLNITSPYAIPNNEWHHIAATYSSSTAKIYVDGIEVISANIAIAPVATAQDFKIGAVTTNYSTTPSTSNYFNGTLQEVRVWDVALSATQIREMMNQHIEQSGTFVLGSHIPVTVSSELLWANLQGYYPLNSNTAFDSSSYGVDGTPIGITTSQSITAPLPYETNDDTAWDTSTTWLNNAVVYVPNTVGIDGSTVIDWNIVELTNDITSGDRDITVLGLISDTGKLTIADPNDLQDETNSGQELNITSYLKLDGVIDLVGESQLIQPINSEFEATSIGYLERDQQGEGNRYRYNDWSSPVYTATDVNGNYTTIASSLRDGTSASTPSIITFTSGQDGAAGPPIQLSTYWMYKYANSPDGDYSSWDPIGSTGNLYAGEGFLMKGTGDSGASDQNYVFVGKPNNGTINLTVAAGYDYLIGNPYPSAIDADQFIMDNANSITGSLYFWEHYGGDSHNLVDYQAGYATYNLSGGVIASSHPSVSSLGTATKLPKRYIAVSQGFFVVGDADGGTIEFNNGQRIFITEASTNSIFMRAENNIKGGTQISNEDDENNDVRPKIRISFEAPNIDRRELLLTIDENATNGVDWGYDAELYEAFNDDMFWIIGDKKYVIQGIRTLNRTTEIPFGIQTLKGGLIKIKVENLENLPENTSVFIKDKTTGETFEITETSFETNLPAGEYLDKFALTFQKRRIKIKIDKLLDWIHVYMNKTSSELLIEKIEETEISAITLFNYFGQKVGSWTTNLNLDYIIIPIDLPVGVYIAQIKTTNGLVVKKILVK